MRFKCRRRDYVDPRKQWHAWFAWYPVEVADGDCRWLEIVERKEVDDYNYFLDEKYWVFRLPVSEKAAP